MSKKPTPTSSDKPTEKAEQSQSNSPDAAKNSASSPAQNPQSNSNQGKQSQAKPQGGKPAGNRNQSRGQQQQQKAASKPAEPAPQPAPQPAPAAAAPVQEKRSGGAVPLLIAVAFTAAVGGALYYFGNTQFMAQQEKIDALQAQLVDRQAAIQAKNQEMLGQIENATKQSVSTQNRVLELEGIINQEEKNHPDLWLLAEAQYHVQLAGRRVFIEHDIDTAVALLVDADKRIRELADPSLSVLRKALADDIAALQAMTQLDRDGLVLALSSLEKQVDNLKVEGLSLPEAIDVAEEPVSGDVSDWQNNLKRSWRSLTDDFVTVRRRDGQVEALMSPEQTVYLKENLKNRFLQAQLAVYRENQEVYVNNLEQAAAWLNQYYQADDSLTVSMLKEIEKFKGQDVSFEPPAELKSAVMLKQMLDQRKQLQLSQQGAS